MTAPPLQGRTVVLTGASSGLGAAAAVQLAEAGATVVPVGRSPEKTAAVAERLGVEPELCDYAHLDDVRALAERLLRRCDEIHVLANNAGALVPHRTTTGDGHELTFQANHLAGFLLTNLLAERLRTTPGARVVTTSSLANRFGSIDLDDLDAEHRRYVGFREYATSKLENIVFTRQVSARLGVPASCFHPGAVASDFGRDSTFTGLLYRTPLRRWFLLTADQGAEPLVDLATEPRPEASDGVYFDRLRAGGRTARQADDPALAAGLWDRSAALVGLADGPSEP